MRLSGVTSALMNDIPNILSIAGSDPSGGAGVQADLKTISALGGYGMAALTALTAQNTQGVEGVHVVPPDFLSKQISALFDDSNIAAVKIGMAGTAESIEVIAGELKRYAPSHIVLDPVMVATSGDVLLSAEATRLLNMSLLPLASVITPNIPEAEILLDGKSLSDFGNNMNKMALALRDKYDVAVLLKGGHLHGDQAIDVLCLDDWDLFEMAAPRVETKNTHGTGCTLSAALATLLGQGVELREAAKNAKAYLSRALAAGDALQVGRGAGPVHHFYNWKDL